MRPGNNSKPPQPVAVPVQRPPADPLELSKAQAAAQLERYQPAPSTTVSAATVSATPVPTPPAPAAADLEPAAEPDIPKAPQFRVLKTKKVSLSGLLTQLNEGQIISTDGYLPATIASIRAQGVQLEEVTS